MNWIETKSDIKPPVHRVLICYCPEWCGSSYQVAYWSGIKFYYNDNDNDQPNKDFSQYVEKWAIFLEAD